VVVGLGEDAFYGFLDESILIQEDNDGRDERSITHINQFKLSPTLSKA
jgi:hypothetical protein